MENLTEKVVVSALDAMNVYNEGNQNRTVAATAMNERSSRSHSVFTLYIESKEEAEGITEIKYSRLNIVDLAVMKNFFFFFQILIK